MSNEIPDAGQESTQTAVSQDQVTDTTSRAIPENVRKILDANPDSSQLMSYVRTQEAEKYRDKIKSLEETNATISQRLADSEKKLRLIDAADSERLVDRLSAMETAISEMQNSVLSVANAVSKTDINSVRYQVLSQIPESILPSEFHHMITGTTREELKASVNLVIEAWNSAKSKAHSQINMPPNGQSQPQAHSQYVAMPSVVDSQQMLQAPTNGPAVDNGGSAVPSTSTIRELTRQALAGNREALGQFDIAASQLVAHELGRK